jgi:hypothetical protein
MNLVLAQLRLEQIVTDTRFVEVPPGLRETMARYGQMDPVHARPLDSDPDRYELTAGKPILVISRAMRRETLAAILESAEIAALPQSLRALVLDAQHDSLTMLHRARFARDLVENEGYSQRDVARLMDRSDTLLSLMLRAIRYPELETMVEREGLPFSGAIELSALEEEAPRLAYLAELREEKLARDRFPTVDEIRRGVQERQGKPGLPELTGDLLLPFVADLMSQARCIDVELTMARRSDTRIRITVPRSQRAEVAAAIERLRTPQERR